MRNKIYSVIDFLIVRLHNNTFSNAEVISVEWDKQIVIGHRFVKIWKGAISSLWRFCGGGTAVNHVLPVPC